MANYTEVNTTDEEYEQELNEIYGDVKICGLEFPAGRALRLLDPTAFRCGLADKEIMFKCDECGTEHEEESEAGECCNDES